MTAVLTCEEKQNYADDVDDLLWKFEVSELLQCHEQCHDRVEKEGGDQKTSHRLAVVGFERHQTQQVCFKPDQNVDHRECLPVCHVYLLLVEF